MKLERLSDNFTPRSEGFIFGLDTESETPSDIEIDIVESGEVVATQFLRGVTTARVNIAPYVKPITEYAPAASLQSPFREAPTRLCTTRCGDVAAETMCLSVNRCVEQTPTLLTTMPRNRKIYPAEVEELFILASAGDSLTANITTDKNKSLTIGYTTATGAAILSLSMTMLDADTKSFDIELFCNGELLDRLHYSVASPRKGALRLAWISERGEIEHYHFPIVAKRLRKCEKECVESEAGYRVVSTKSESLIWIRSAYESKSLIEALSQIVSSPRVWIWQSGAWSEVEVLTSQIEKSIFGEPDCLVLCVSEWHREESAL